MYLSMYGKTIQMMILARVNGYYSPYLPSTIMHEGDQAKTGEVLNIAEEEFLQAQIKNTIPQN